MSIGESIAKIRKLLDRLHSYEHMIDTDTFEPGTIDDMEGKAEDLCDKMKEEIDNIKSEIGQWG